MAENYDALLLLSFGGPERREDVMPFLENVLRGKNVPRERMLEVAEHYYHFDGVSPINGQNRALLDALKQELTQLDVTLPIYWGNRNWHPLLTDTLRQMKADGVRRALAFVTSIFSCYSGCRQYLEDIERARADIGEDAPAIDKLRSGFNHPGFIEAVTQCVQDAVNSIPTDRRTTTQVIFTAHSIPLTMARTSAYEQQLREACRLVSEAAGQENWRLVYQSRSGPPAMPWLEPDVCDYLKEIHAEGKVGAVVLVPLGFTSDHMEVLFDLDTEAQQVCDELNLRMVRAATVGTHPKFVTMIRQLVQERVGNLAKLSLGTLGPSHDLCPADCCPSGRPTARG